jgi:anti-sigma regulatory factor (Ser/Thr protein kinase)
MSLLIFDEHPGFAGSLAQWLDANHVANAAALHTALSEQLPSLLLTDAHAYLRYRLYYPEPTCPVVWMTASPISSLLRMAIAHNITMMLPKQLPLNLTFWHMVLQGSQQGAMPMDALVALGGRRLSWMIQNSDDILEGFYRMRTFFEEGNTRALDDLCTVYMEAVSNAVYHAVKAEDGHDLYPKGSYIEALPPEAWVYVTLWQDDEKAGLHVRDQGGTVRIEDALYWLDRHTRGAGQLDVHGRGFYLMRLLTDGCALTVSPGQCTYVAAWQYHHPSEHINKPLLFLKNR